MVSGACLVVSDACLEVSGGLGFPLRQHVHIICQQKGRRYTPTRYIDFFALFFGTLGTVGKYTPTFCELDASKKIISCKRHF